MDKIKIVVATRENEKDFYGKTATGRSLSLYKMPALEIHTFFNNSLGLSKVYNKVIRESAHDPCMLIFMHDDLHILDYYWLQQIAHGLQHFQILGVVGSKRRVDRQSNWAFVDAEGTWDDPKNLSGIVGHGKGFPPQHLNAFGPPGQKVKLLDGLMLCAASTTLVEHDLYFDEAFDFHFYDMDFCRQAEQKNLSCGTWPISLIHESVGSAGSDAWKSSYEKYLNKWGS